MTISTFWPNARLRRRWLRTLRRAPPTTQAIVAVVVVFALWLGLNWAYQVIRKPSELFFPVSGALYKTPYETAQAVRGVPTGVKRGRDVPDHGRGICGGEALLHP